MSEIEVEPTEPKQHSRGRLRAVFNWVRETTFILVFALVLSVLLRTFVFQAFYVPSGSMMDTLLINDRIIASKLALRFGQLHRGDIIVFSDPGDWLPEPETEDGFAGKVKQALTWVGVLPANSGKDLVKRVIGLPGDRVKCCDAGGNIVVNGYSLQESAYVLGKSTSVQFDIVVPAGRIFVMGDNREFSGDSRFHLEDHFGTVPLENVVGQVDLQIWPLSRFKTLANPLAEQPIPNPAG